MPIYRLCDLTVQSNVPLPELPPARSRKPECVFQLLRARPRGSDPAHWLHEWRLPAGRPWLLLGKHQAGFLLRFPALGDFVVSADGGKVRCYPQKGTPIETIRHLFLDQVFPLILSQHGRLVLHASAILAPEGALAFLGETGQGKSTLASSLSKQGFPFLTDDCLLVKEEGGQLVGIPSYPGLRLWPETVAALFGEEPRLTEIAHYTAKKRLGHGGQLPFCSAPVPLRRIYFLVDAQASEDIGIRQLSPRDAFVELVKYVYLIDVRDRKILKREFERLGRLVKFPLFYRLAFPRVFALLPQVQKAILHHATR
jgi:hypothetical protein